MKNKLNELQQVSAQAIAAADSLEALEELRVKFLGKKGELTAILKMMGKLSAEEILLLLLCACDTNHV